MIRRLLPLIVAALTVTLLARPASAADTGYQQELDRYRTANGAVGAMVTARDGDAVTGFGSGSAQVFPRAGLGEDTRFRVGSQTKMLVAAVILQLADEGAVDLDAPIEHYLPGVVRGQGLDPNAITVRHLLAHRSGIKDNLGFLNGDYLQSAVLLLNPVWQVRPPTPQQLVDAGTMAGKQFEPGAKGVYSNTGYVLLGMLIERATGADLPSVLTERIIDPVGMTSTFYPRPGQKDLPAPAARGYLSVAGLPFADVTHYEPGVWGAAGALVSTGADMTRFLNALLRGEIVSPARLDEMRHTQPMDGNGEYGLGLLPMETDCGRVWGHTGGVAGYSTITVSNGTRAMSAGSTNTPLLADGATAQDALRNLANQAICG